jgi:hypothetical protein
MKRPLDVGGKISAKYDFAPALAVAVPIPVKKRPPINALRVFADAVIAAPVLKRILTA